MAAKPCHQYNKSTFALRNFPKQNSEIRLFFNAKAGAKIKLQTPNSESSFCTNAGMTGIQQTWKITASFFCTFRCRHCLWDNGVM